jgi:glutamate synthase (NADPH/NADH) small chain
MSSKMLKFVSTDKKMPDKRDADARVQDFGEIYDEFDASVAEDQAARCSQCGVPFCQINCPLHNNIPDWLMLTAEGRLEEAYRSLRRRPTTCLKSVAASARRTACAKVIASSRIGPRITVTIGAVEKHITDTAFERGWVKPVPPPRELDRSVGIIGAGPCRHGSRRACCAKKAMQVTIYDRYDRIGGLLIYGIPGFKLEKHVVERRQPAADGGVFFTG